jgi:hypothetical protein
LISNHFSAVTTVSNLGPGQNVFRWVVVYADEVEVASTLILEVPSALSNATESSEPEPVKPAGLVYDPCRIAGALVALPVFVFLLASKGREGPIVPDGPDVPVVDAELGVSPEPQPDPQPELQSKLVMKDDKKPAFKAAAKRAVKTESKTNSSANEQAKAQKAIAKANKAEAQAAKVEKARTDRHDRSGRGSHVRKEGKGTGGWDDNKPTIEEADVDPDAEEEETEEQKAAEAAAAAEEAAEREREEKQMTLEEYKEKLKAEGPVAGALNIRTVDDSGFKGMVAKKAAVEDDVFQIGGKAKKAGGGAKKAEAKKDKVQIDVGFRSENPTRQREGKGKGKGKGEGKGRGGRGGYSADKAAPQVDDEELFPALGAPAPAAE